MKATVKGLAYVLALICMLSSCISYFSMSTADSNAKKLTLGMTKEEVVSIMGEEYEVISSKEGTFTLGYKSWDSGIYKLFFIDGKLKEWNKEWFRDTYTKDNSAKTPQIQVDDSATKAHLDAHRNAMLSTASSDAERFTINAHMDALENSMLKSK